MTPSNNTARPAVGLGVGLGRMLGGGHALARVRTTKSRATGREDVIVSLGRASGGFRSGRRRRWATAVQIFDVEHDEFPAFLWDALQNEVSFIILKDLLHIF